MPAEHANAADLASVEGAGARPAALTGLAGFFYPCRDRDAAGRGWPHLLRGGLMAQDVIVETRKLTKIYRDFWGRQKKTALRALNLQINRGEIFGLLGPNGSHNTTPTTLPLRLLSPTDGEALVFGQPGADVKKNERIGSLPEESSLSRFLNAEETLDFYGRLFDMPADVRRKRAGELIDMVGLS